MDAIRVLVASFDSVGMAQSLETALKSTQLFESEVRKEAYSGGSLVEYARMLSKAASRTAPNVIVVCLSPSRRHDAKGIFDLARKHLRGAAIVAAMDSEDLEEWRELFELEPADFIASPFRPMDVVSRVWRLGCCGSNGDNATFQLKEKLGLKQLVGQSPSFVEEITKIPFIARCDSSVLIGGETGTGKEMFARAIHHLSSRAAKPFTPVNCGAIPVDLLENELFGHDPGAFTGANAASAGLIRETAGGSLFLDEVDCLPLLAQVKLLRFLQEKEFRPLGASKSCRVDVRVIAASNANLEEALAKGRFRQDLYYRLNVVTLSLPPLRERKEDIPVLANHFLAKYAATSGASSRHLSAAAVQKLMLHDWSGNVRELENVIERSLILSSRVFLQPEDIRLPAGTVSADRESFRTMKAKTIAQFERSYIQDLLRKHDGNISKAAHAAGKHRRAFWEIMRKHQIHVAPQATLPPTDDSGRTFLSQR